ncbi:MAG: hypothetical protein ACRD0B_12960, partial [Acidimicrobiales bacterium]
MSTVEQGAPSFDWAGVVDYTARYANEPPKTQYQLPGVTEELHDVPCAGGSDHEGVPVAVVPLWHSMVTARLTVPDSDTAALKHAKSRLETALSKVEEIYPLSPAGVLTQVAWGLSYFTRFLPETVLN